jgi:hypothetical protein
MCFSNVFSLAPEINDFFRCLRFGVWKEHVPTIFEQFRKKN